MKHLLKFSAACLLFAGTSVLAETYIVKKGDTLASIARQRYGEPVFGPKGSMKRIFKMNPRLKQSVPLEPGQKITLEDKMNEYPDEKVAPVKAIKAPPAAVLAPAISPESASMMSPAERAAHEMDLNPRGPVPPASEEPVAVHEKPAVHEAHATHGVENEAAAVIEEAHPHNYFSILPTYSMITQNATENATNESFSLHSSPAWGAELGWDHWWNNSFSTVLTYAFSQFTSKESSDVTGQKVLKNINLNRTELALLNRVIHWMRIGAGAAYGDHLFLESFGGTPSNPQVYKMSYLNPFLTAELTAFESAKLEALVNLKISQLPAQVGFGHDVAAGAEYFGQVSLLQKFSKFAVLYGLSYSTENQTRTDATETRTEWALKIGALF